jgi:hypothetical protein
MNLALSRLRPFIAFGTFIVFGSDAVPFVLTEQGEVKR